jgi:hypothetical protein
VLEQERQDLRWAKLRLRYPTSKDIGKSLDGFIYITTIGLLEDDAEELAGDILVGKPKLDLPVYAAGPDEGVLQPLDVVCRHDEHPAFLRRYAVNRVEKPG